MQTRTAAALREELARLDQTRRAQDWHRIPRLDRLAILRRIRALRRELATIRDTM